MKRKLNRGIHRRQLEDTTLQRFEEGARGKQGSVLACL